MRGARGACGARRRGGGRSVVVTELVAAREGAAGEVEALVGGLQEALRGARRPGRAGLQEFKAERDVFEEGVFHLWARYDSAASAEEGLASPLMQGFLADVAPLSERPVGMSMFEQKDGQLSSAMVDCGPKGEGGLDDATGANKFGGGASYQQTSSAVDLGSLDPEERMEGLVA